MYYAVYRSTAYEVSSIEYQNYVHTTLDPVDSNVVVISTLITESADPNQVADDKIPGARFSGTGGISPPPFRARST